MRLLETKVRYYLTYDKETNNFVELEISRMAEFMLVE